ncbi:ISL3 family transposase [Enterococcus rivorum]|uniref:ISL3 family transposase n=1 Tax=Enterococcus rivorum TaxID=762845 RepID=A0A1E5KXC5_9ENTE|nr:ISL3 family transposase [Enterococcus rivorum]MBP2099872.1 transposase [Enterococcus rivorum]OEH82512.1 ISL3 family transposase [Enterococcus rivorum]
MSLSNLIKETLDILDLNLIFTENCLTHEKIGNHICKVYSGTLTYFPEKCLHCQQENDQTIIKYGWKKVMVLVNDVSEYKTYVRIKKQKFLCKSCNRSFLAESTLTERHCTIARRVKLSIAEKLKENTSMTGIARAKHVSTTTIYRVLKNFYTPLSQKKKTLPTVLCFDEFKSVKESSGAMSFVFMDGQTKELLDIVENRKLNSLKKYFYSYAYKTRAAVQYIVIDMYKPYVTLVKKLFPNAKLIIDRFHIVQHIGRTFLTHRIQQMNQLNRKNYQEEQQYKHLKKYWKLLQKNAWHLEHKKQVWHPSFRAHLTESEVVDRLLSYSPELKQGYGVYQDFLAAVRMKDSHWFQELLKQNYSHLPEKYATTIQTFKQYQEGILNALEQPYSNGSLECLNNHIKVLKRNAYGFRSFYNFKLRILLTLGTTLFNPMKKNKPAEK